MRNCILLSCPKKFSSRCYCASRAYTAYLENARGFIGPRICRMTTGRLLAMMDLEITNAPTPSLEVSVSCMCPAFSSFALESTHRAQKRSRILHASESSRIRRRHKCTDALTVANAGRVITRTRKTLSADLHDEFQLRR